MILADCWYQQSELGQKKISADAPLTRNTELKACNPYIATPPCHIDTNRIVLRATFGGQGEENVLNIRGDTDNRLFRDVPVSLIQPEEGPLR